MASFKRTAAALGLVTACAVGTRPARPEHPLTVIATLVARPDQADALAQALADLTSPSRAEPGNINYDVHRSTADPTVFVVYENYRDRAAFEAHLVTPHVRAFQAVMDMLLARPFELQYLTMTSPWAPSRW